MTHELLFEKLTSIDPPVWESENAELYSSSPGLNRFVIWENNPTEQGVQRYDRFDNYDPLPHHYYKNDAEYATAKQKYINGGYPDKLIDVNSYPAWDRINRSIISEVIIYESILDQSDSYDQERAA